MSRGKVVVLDGSSLVYRAFFALPVLTTADGTPTNAVFGFTSMLVKCIEDHQPDVLLLAFEGGKTFRHVEFADYKAHRPRTPDDLAVQGHLTRAMAEAFRVPILQHAGFEADDLLGTIARRGEADGFDVLVVTGDLDALQLVTERVRVVVNRKGLTDIQIYDIAGVQERFGLLPAQLPDFKALKGDPSDNIPGIAGIGDKTATALLQEHGDLEHLLAALPGMKPGRVRQNLVEGREQALLYRRLATIVGDLPVETPWDAWKYAGPDLPRVLDLCRRLEFRMLGRRVETIYGAGAPAPEPLPAAEIVPDQPLVSPAEGSPDLAAWIEQAAAAGVVSVRCKSARGGPRAGTLLGVALSAGGRSLLLGEAGEGEGLLAAAGEPCSIPASVAELLESGRVRLLGHDLKREHQSLAAAGLAVPEPAGDTLLAAYVINPGRGSYRLDDLAQEYGVGQPAGVGMERLASEARTARAIHDPMQARIARDDLRKVYEELELPLIPILARLEMVGVAVDRAELGRLSSRLARRVAEIESLAREVAGCDFNLGSPKQLQELLFGRLNLPAGRKTKTGYSTDSDVLQDLALVHPLPGLILEYRELSKLKSTYADALQSLIDPETGRIHTRLHQAVAATGRLSSSDPNLQNIPIRTEAGREIRAAFVAAPGMKLLSADYSQIELRIMAHISRDEGLVQAFEQDQDVHVATASRVFEVPPESVTADQRRSAKTVNFAVLYGQREFGLSRQLRIDISRARQLIDAYLRQFPGVLEYTRHTLAQIRTTGHVATLPPYSRKRYIPAIHSANRNERMAAEREAVNAPVQGTAADVIKAAMIQVDRELRRSGMRSRMILQVHDELLFEILPEEEEAMKELVRRNMESAYELSVPLQVGIKTGANWRDVEAGDAP